MIMINTFYLSGRHLSIWLWLTHKKRHILNKYGFYCTYIPFYWVSFAHQTLGITVLRLWVCQWWYNNCTIIQKCAYICYQVLANVTAYITQDINIHLLTFKDWLRTYVMKLRCHCWLSSNACICHDDYNVCFWKFYIIYGILCTFMQAIINYVKFSNKLWFASMHFNCNLQK